MIIAVTNRHICRGDLLSQVEKIARAGVDAVILREKDLPEDQYFDLAAGCDEICKKFGVRFIAHHYVEAAAKLGFGAIHLTWDDFSARWEKLSGFARIGVSVHSVRDAVLAAGQGASYLIAGHIFATDCKKGVVPRGLSFLSDICAAVEIPVFAVGGISADNAHSVIQSGAAGFCVMSGLMTDDNPELTLTAYREALRECGEYPYRPFL